MELEECINLDDYFTDSTCVKANIHSPIDCILLRDATRTLIKAVKFIRKHGLKNRMDDPSGFINDMNKLCINMTHTKGKKDGRKKSRQFFRMMKNSFTRSKASETTPEQVKEEAKQIFARIENILR